MMLGSIFLLVLCTTFCSVRCQFSEQSSNLQSVAELQDPSAVLDALFGVETCVGGNCGGYEVAESSSVYPEHEQAEETYEPQQPDPESQYPDDEEQEEIYEPQYPEVGVPDEAEETDEITHSYLCENFLQALNEIEGQHPDVSPVTIKVFDDLMNYMAHFAHVEKDNCNPAIKLLNIIISAAESLRKDYQMNSEAVCDYEETTEEPEDATYEEDETDEDSYETTVDYATSEYPTMEPCYGDSECTGDADTEEPSEHPCTEESSTPGYEPSTEKPCPEEEQTEEIIAEEYDEHISPPFVGSVRGIPGEHYPNYTEVPITSFSCADKKCIPGFYADLETGCQVFHVCYEHRRESFLCPLGTIFNQPILACDYWYSSNCSLAPSYYDVNCETDEAPEEDDTVGKHITSIIEAKPEHSVQEYPELPEDSLDELVKFLPVKAKVTVFTKTEHPEKPVAQDVEEVAADIFDKIVTATKVATKTRAVIAKIPEPAEAELKIQIKKPLPLLKPKLVKAAVVPALKMKAIVPKAKFIGKVAAIKTAVPVAKFVAAKAAIPVAKTKLVVGKKLAVKAAVPVMTKKVVAGKAIAAVPVMAKKVVAGKTIAVKAKVAVPVVTKSKLAAGKVIATKAAVPVAAKTKLVFAKAAAPVKFAAGKKIVLKGAASAKLPIVKAAAIKGPALKTKILAASLPFAKTAFLKSSLPVKAKIAPVLKAKLFKSASIPLVKGKLMTLPLAKSKLFLSAPLAKAKVAKAVAISPLTKKALALGYMKLLKAKKVALMG